jgi:hypothetical protein
VLAHCPDPSSLPSSLFAARTRAIRSLSGPSGSAISATGQASGPGRRIELDVNEQNEAALRFYESLGFTTEPKPPGRTLFVSRKL